MAIIEEIFEDEEDQITKVDSLKKEGNNFFANGEFEKANEKYQVLECFANVRRGLKLVDLRRILYYTWTSINSIFI